MRSQRGLGRGLGALIAPSPALSPAEAGGTEPAAPPRVRTSPTDVFFDGGGRPRPDGPGAITASAVAGDPAPVDAPTPEPAGDVGGQVVGELRLVPVAAIVPNPRQPRTVFDEDALDELTASIREVGVLQPVVVRPVPGEVRFELVMGERRWRASQAAGLDEIPAVVRITTDDDLLRDALLENLHRSELNPLEEAAAYAQLLEDFACTHDQLSQRLGTSRSHLTNTMRLLNLSPAVQRRVAAGVLSAGHARALLGLEDPAAQDAMAARIVAEGLSVRSVEELVAVAAPARRRRVPSGTRTGEGQLDDVAARLTDRFDTRVRVQMGRSKGRLTVEFAGVDDLERILAAMGVAPVSS